MNAIRIDKREFTINGDTAIHTPTGAKFFAEPGGIEVVNWDWGTALPGRLMDEYEEQDLLVVAAEVLEERFVVEPVPVPIWTKLHDLGGNVRVRSYLTGGAFLALLAGLGAMIRIV